jgi:hypothetical protein
MAIYCTRSPWGALRHLQDHETLLCTQHIGYFTSLQREDTLFKSLGQLTPLETANRSSLRRGWSLGVRLGKIGNRTTSLNCLPQSLGLVAGFSDLCRGIRRRSADQHFAKTNSILNRVVGTWVCLRCLCQAWRSKEERNENKPDWLSEHGVASPCSNEADSESIARFAATVDEIRPFHSNPLREGR